ncbi:MAG: UbiH/UbiF/VisC/COQ6 family ubiquinone biosynthesis hydroxylase [Mariprofundaceae bacterium]|nr:UbiH/UbiF/VisC/COQ6 family ubiquinone biosynthesis hydroxylase [Mariprofundaceae bacterium]
MQTQDRKGEAVDLLIVGAGMVGLMLAAALRHTGLHIVLVERLAGQARLSLGRDCRVSAIVQGNVRILQRLGVWKYLEQDAGMMTSMRIWDGQEQGGMRFDASEIDEETLGYLLENRVLLDGLRQSLQESVDVELLCPESVQQVLWRRDGVQVQLAGGRVLETPLIVGADGANSWLRGQADIDVFQRDYGQQGIVANVSPRFSHQNTAFQRFLSTGPLAVLPMPDNMCSIVWSCTTAESERLLALSDAAFMDDLNEHLGGLCGGIVEVGQRAAFPLKAQLARHIVRHRLALIGDAAHSIHPLAGLGVNLGLRDAMVLAQEIVDARKFEEDWGELAVLNRYMKQRMPDVLLTMASMEALHQTFQAQLPAWVKLRGLGMKMMGNAGVVKQLLMKNTTGINLPVPHTIE